MPPVLHRARVVLPVSASPIQDGGVLVEGGRVTAVGRADELPGQRTAQLVEHGDAVLTPGLVNAHAHLEYGAPFADLATSGLPFPTWIATLTKRRRAVDAEGWLAAARDGVRRLLATGTTAVADVVTHGAGTTAAAEAGVAGVSYVEAVGADDERWAAVERDRVVRLLDAAPPGRAVGLSPHTLYSLGTAVFRAVVELARSRGLRLHPHLAETLDEEEYVLAGTGSFATAMAGFGLRMELPGTGGSGARPAAHLDALGGLGPDVHVAHGVHLDAADRALLRERGTVVALCARSNATLAAGAPPVAAHLAEGSRIAVGTDSLASSPSLDLLAELRALRDLAAGQGAPTGDLAQRLLEAATTGGAAAMGLDDVGALRPGARADLAVWAVDDPRPSPYDAVLDSGRCVATVLAGEPVHP